MSVFFFSFDSQNKLGSTSQGNFFGRAFGSKISNTSILYTTPYRAGMYSGCFFIFTLSRLEHCDCQVVNIPVLFSCHFEICDTRGIFLVTCVTTSIALQVARKISCVTPIFATCNATKCCIASCKKSRTIFNFSECCETSCCV